MTASERAPGQVPSESPLERYAAVRARSEALAAPLSPEDCGLQSMPDASPVKWHLAHTSWYFETFVLAPALPGYRPFRPERGYRVLFNSYYNSVGAQHARPERGLLSRPGLDEVMHYRAHVDEALLGGLEQGAFDAEVLEVLLLGTHHEQQHQELILTDLLHAFSRNPLEPVYRGDDAGKMPPGRASGGGAAGFQRFGGGLREIGHDGAGFAFDNEGPRHRVHLEPFALAERPVSNAEYQAFVDDGGYRDPAHWLSDGWARVQADGWEAPLYWARGDAGWSALTLRGRRPLAPDAPVCHLSFFEADAYARWAGARLPTEAEWECATADAAVEGNTLESDALQPRPDGRPGLAQLFGDVWEWTSSAYGPYPGFRPPPGALGEYNGKFMSGQMVLRGGSCATPADHLRASYRNFFHPQARWQFSGMRLARDA